MTEHNTEAIEEMNEPIEVVTPEPTPIKSKKARSDLQLKALANARQAAYKIRAEQAAIKKQNKGKKTPDVSKVDPEEIPDDSKNDLPENKNENIRDDVKK